MLPRSWFHAGKPFDGAGVGRELNPPINCHTSFGEAGILTAADAFPIAKLLRLFVSLVEVRLGRRDFACAAHAKSHLGWKL